MATLRPCVQAVMRLPLGCSGQQTTHDTQKLT